MDKKNNLLKYFLAVGILLVIVPQGYCETETIETPIVPKKIFLSPPLTPLTLQLTPEYSPLEMKCPNAP